jgi:hypothetical protein
VCLAHKQHIIRDVGINKPFKDYTRLQYDEWCEMNTNGTGAHRRDAARWCSSSCSQISPITIMKTWNHIGYTSVDNGNGTVGNDEVEVVIRQTNDDSDDTQDTEDSTVAYSLVEEESEVDSAEEVIIESDSSADSDSDDDLMYFDFFINNLNRDNITANNSTNNIVGAEIIVNEVSTQVSTTQVSTNKDDESK